MEALFTFIMNLSKAYEIKHESYENHSNLITIFKTLIEKPFLKNHIEKNFQHFLVFLFDKSRFCFTSSESILNFVDCIEEIFNCFKSVLSNYSHLFFNFVRPLMDLILQVFNEKSLISVFPVCFKIFTSIMSKSKFFNFYFFLFKFIFYFIFFYFFILFLYICIHFYFYFH